jgi:hypothetical protein
MVGVRHNDAEPVVTGVRNHNVPNAVYGYAERIAEAGECRGACITILVV